MNCQNIMGSGAPFWSQKSCNLKIIIQDKNSLFRSLVEASEDSKELLRMLNVDDTNDDKPRFTFKKQTAF